MDGFAGIDRKHPDLLPLGILLLLAVGFFFSALFLGRAAMMNSGRMFEPWRSVLIENGEGTVEQVGNNQPVYKWKTPEGFADDMNRQFVPWGLYSQERIREGGWPLWNPHLACGQPLYANHQTGLANPLILLCYYIFPGLAAFTAIFFSVFVLAGWGMYAYLRILGLGRWPALLAAVTYQFMLGYIPAQDTLVVEKALFPFLLYSIERIVRAPAGKGGVWVFLSILLLALVQTSCHAYEAVFISYLLGPYIVFIAGDANSFSRGRVWRTIGKRIVLALGIYILAILVGLAQNFPTLEFYERSTRFAGFEEQAVQASLFEQSLTWIQSLMFAFPRLFGDYLLQNMPLEHYLLNYGYVGVVTLLAASFAGWISATRRQLWFWRIAALVFFVSIIWNWFYFNILCGLPLFRISLMKPFGPFFFAIVVLAGHGFRFLLEPKRIGTPGNRWTGYASVVVFASALSMGGLFLYSLVDPTRTFSNQESYAFGQVEIGACVAALACLVVGFYWRFTNKQNSGPKKLDKDRALMIAALALMGVILIDLWPVKAHFNPFVPRNELYFSTNSVEFLKSRLEWKPGNPDGPYRFGRSWKEVLPPNTGMVLGLDDFGGYDSNLVGRYAQLLKTVDPSIVVGVHYIETPRYREERPGCGKGFEAPLWDMLGVKYVVAHPGHLGQFVPPERWRHVWMNGILLVQNIDALPRMHLVERVTAVSRDEEALELAARLDPSVEAVVERDDPLPVELSPVEDPTGNPPGTVVITDYRPEKVTASVSCERPALLCFFDTWFPGWTVEVDGKPADLERVDYTFKGVFLDKGDHEVIFSYRPRSVLYGLLGTLAGLVLTLLLARPLSRLGGHPPPIGDSLPGNPDVI